MTALIPSLLRRRFSWSLIRSFGSCPNRLFSTSPSLETSDKSKQTVDGPPYDSVRIFGSRILPFSASPSLETFDRSKSCSSELRSIRDGLPFDSIERNPKNGIITLRRNTKDECIIIQVTQKPIDYEYDDPCIESLREDEDDFDVVHNDDYEMPSEKEEEEKVGGPDDEFLRSIYRGKYNVLPHLKIHVNIFYGDNFNRCFEAFCDVSHNNRDFILIHHVLFRNKRKRRRDHLEEFEDFFKKRGIEHCNFRFFFDYLEKSDEIRKEFTDKIGDKIGEDVTGYFNEVVPLPSGFPFELIACYNNGKHSFYMKRMYQKEDIKVEFEFGMPPIQAIYGNSDILLKVNMEKGKTYTTSLICPMPDRLDIAHVNIMSYGEKMEDYREYLKSKGIMSETISFLYNLYGYKGKHDIPLI